MRLGILTMARAGSQIDPRDVYQTPTGKTGTMVSSSYTAAKTAAANAGLPVNIAPRIQPHLTPTYLQPSSPQLPSGLTPGEMMQLDSRIAAGQVPPTEYTPTEEQAPFMSVPADAGEEPQEKSSLAPLALAALALYFMG